jgi:tetratricopeptide (TPR) repeat protein
MGRRKVWLLISTVTVIGILIIGGMVSVAYFIAMKDPNESDDHVPVDPYSIEHSVDLHHMTLTEEREQEIFDQGIGHHERGEHESALEKWYLLYRFSNDLQTWGKATYNMGIEYFCLERYEDAIYYFQEVLNSSVDDKEPGSHIMETNRNYHHWSCTKIADCYERMEEFDKALEYMILSTEEYTYYSWCGTCAESQWRYLEDRISQLEDLVRMIENGTVLSEFIYTIEIFCYPPMNYTLFVPVPMTKNDGENYTRSIRIEDVDLIEGSSSYMFNITEYGPALNVTGSSNTTLEVNITIKNGTSMEDKDILDRFSMFYEYSPHRNWIYSEFEGFSTLYILFSGKWITVPPEYERWSWEEYIRPGLGWSDHEIF